MDLRHKQRFPFTRKLQEISPEQRLHSGLTLQLFYKSFVAFIQQYSSGISYNIQHNGIEWDATHLFVGNFHQQLHYDLSSKLFD